MSKQMPATVEVPTSFILRMIATEIRKCVSATPQDIRDLASRVDGMADAVERGAAIAAESNNGK